MKMFVVFAVALALPAMAQQSAIPQSRNGEIAAAARIYGYNLAEGNWTESPGFCTAMPQAILLHYHREFPDRTESVFTAIVPRAAGQVRIVPVLYHGATPFVPAPRNPRNYALFNSLEAASDSGFDTADEKHWREAGACYAEMTGGTIENLQDSRVEIAGQPSPTVLMDLQTKTARVVVAERNGSHSYQVWSILLNRKGKITSVRAEQEAVYEPKLAHSTVISSSTNTSEVAAAKPPAPQETSKRESQTLIQPEPSLSAPDEITTASSRSVASTTQDSAIPSQPGWKPIVNPAEPPSKLIPDAPPPAQKFIPNPPGGADHSKNAE